MAKKHINCDCDCHKTSYEFLFVCDDTSPYNYNYGNTQIQTWRGHTAKDALMRIKEAIGNFWSVQGFRKQGSKRWNKCYVKAWKTEKTFWPNWK